MDELIRLIGLKSLTVVGQGIFGIRAMKEEFTPGGMMQSLQKFLMKLDILSLMKGQRNLRLLMFIPSGPGALLSERLFKEISISCSEMQLTKNLLLFRDRVGRITLPNPHVSA